MHKKILDFWFSNGDKWFNGGKDFDDEITDEFMSTYLEAINGELDDWQYDPTKSLALTILLDQFPRNMFRGSGKAFEYDFKGLYLTKSGLKKGYLDEYSTDQKRFFLMPLMHSESLPDQELCVKYFSELAEKNDTFEVNKKFAIEHRDIIEKFGRFPHRNEALGRESTQEEKEFLKNHDGF